MSAPVTVTAPTATAPTAINIWLKTMAGEMLPLSVAPSDTLQDIARELPLTYPQFPAYYTKVLRLSDEDGDEKDREDRKDRKDRPLEEDETLCVFVHEVFTEQTFDGNHMVVVQHPLLELTLGVTHFLDEWGIPDILRKKNVVRYNLYYMESDGTPCKIPHSDGCIFLTSSLIDRIPSISWLTLGERQNVLEEIRTRISVHYASQKITVAHARYPKERHLCECGSDIMFKTIDSHEKTKKHRAFLQTKSDSTDSTK
jgi:hypothetical protein